jgi:hypothetical protein
MRKCTALLLLSVPAVTLAQGNEAEKLFRKMEEKIMKAKTLKAVAAADYNSPDKGPGKLKIAGQLGEGDRCRIELNVDAAGKEFAVVFASDGTKAQMELPGGMVKPAPATKDIGKILRATHARVGPFGVAMMLFSPKAGEVTDIDKMMGVSGFKAGADEKVNGRDAKVVEYNVEFGNTKKSGKVKVWIDAATMLPLKRHITPSEGGEVTETYSEFTTDAKIDPKTFELTK